MFKIMAATCPFFAIEHEMFARIKINYLMAQFIHHI